MTTEVITDQPKLSPGERRHLTALEKRIEAGLQTFREVGEALLDIRDSRLYRDTHASFELYCRDKWNLDRNRAYQLIGAAEVAMVLGRGADEELTNEAQARVLVPLVHEDPATVKAIWKQVRSRAKDTNAPITATLIRQVTKEVTAPEDAPAPVTMTERLVAAMLRVSDLHRRWVESEPKKREQNTVAAAFRKLEQVFAED